MKKFYSSKLIPLILGLSLLGTPLCAIAVDTGPGGADDWKFGMEAYLWAPWIDVTTETGSDVEISLKDILDNLDMLFMSAFSVGKGKWSLVADLIYFDLEDNANDNLPLSLKLDDVNLEAWVVTPQVRYNAYETSKYKLDLVGGARYLWLEAKLQLKTRPPLPPDSRHASDSGSVWDGIIGVAGQMDLRDKWYLLGYLDVGTGDSDYTWQAQASVGYRFKKVHAMAGYRYLDYDLGSDEALSKLKVHGPYAGVRFMF